MSRTQLIRNLLGMAAADGSLTQSELELLADRATQWGLSPADFESALNDALRPDAELEIPPGHADRRELLRELLVVMAADGHLAEQEKALFAAAAAVMEIDGPELNEIIDEALGDLEG